MKKFAFRFGCMIVFWMVATVYSTASTDFPPTPAGNRAKEIFAFLNTPDSQSIEKYINKHYTPDFKNAFALAQHKAAFTTTQTIFGHLKLYNISKSAPEEISFTLKSDTRDAWLNVDIVVEADEPHRIQSFGIRPGSAPSSIKPENRIKDLSATDEQIGNGSEPRKILEKRFENFDAFHQDLTAKAEKNEFSGVVLVAKDGMSLFQKAYGFASKRFQVSNRIDTKFNLGSCNKLFTSIAAAQLIEKGKLALDDPVGKYLNMFPAEIAEKVTVRHLLNMRSGWGDYWSLDAYRSRVNNLRMVSDYMDFIKDMPIDYEPGTNFQHSNTGFNVLGAIIEKISGMDYYEYIKKNIYEPAGMTNSDSFHKDGPVVNLAEGYTNMNPFDPAGEGYRWTNRYLMPPRGTPAGGGYSTAGDLLKFDQALRKYKLLTQGYTHMIFKNFKGQPDDPFEPERTFRAMGGAPGISAYLGMDLKSGYTIIVLSNYDFPRAMEVAEEIVQMFEIQ